VREYLLVLCVAAGVTWLLTPLARALAIRIGAMAAPRDRDVHAIPTPRLGGLAMYAGVCAAFAVAHSLPSLSAIFKYSDVQAVLVAGGIITLVGFVDDRFQLDAITKLAGQTVAAGVLVLIGLQLITITLPGVGAISLGPDGVLAGVGAIAALTVFAVSYTLASGKATFGVAQERISAPTLIAVVLAGVCLGFLPHNFNPARIFMGDSGSMLVGLMLSASVTSLTGQVDYSNLAPKAAFPVILPLLLPLAVLAVPFVDLFLAVIRRTRAGRSPFSPDKMHLHHRLMEIGHSHKRAVVIMYFWTALLAFSGVALSLASVLQVIAVTSCLALAGLIALSLPRLRSRRA
jgi:UDP-GlcNAc:undecaprenyl-phosphate GlcNAc-1-phosphate transferase